MKTVTKDELQGDNKYLQCFDFLPPYLPKGVVRHLEYYFKHYGSDKVAILGFEDVYALRQYLTANRNNFHEEVSDKSSLNYDEYDFYETETFEEYIQYLESGSDYQDALIKDADKLVKEKLKEMEVIEQTTYNYNVEGEFFDIGEVLAGSPEHFLQSEDMYKNEKTIEIVVDLSGHGGIDGKRMAETGKNIVALCKLLEYKGIRTKIVGFYAGMMSDSVTDVDRLFVGIPLKDYNQPFDYRKISAIMHPSFLRRAVFKIKEVTGIWASGYGRSISTDMSGCPKGLVQIKSGHGISSLIKQFYE